MYIRSINSTREMDVRPASIEMEFRKTGLSGRAAIVKATPYVTYTRFRVCQDERTMTSQ